jgi:fatty acid desaturase
MIARTLTFFIVTLPLWCLGILVTVVFWKILLPLLLVVAVLVALCWWEQGRPARKAIRVNQAEYSRHQKLMEATDLLLREPMDLREAYPPR